MALPPGPGLARDQYILEAAAAGAMQYEWAHLTSTIPGHTATFAVFAKAAKVDGLYVGVGARVLQQIADTIGCSLLTPRLQDMMYEQAPTKILPWLDYDLTRMQTTEWFRRSTVGIDNLLAKAGYQGGLAQGMGKPWMLDNDLLAHPGRAENYGLYVPVSTLQGGKYFGVTPERSVSLPSVMCLQGRGWAHTLDQDDYSELVVLASRQCVVDDTNRDLADVLRDPELAPLASHQGALKIVRQPGVPILSCKIGTGYAPVADEAHTLASRLTVHGGEWWKGAGRARTPLRPEERRMLGLGYGEDGKTACKIDLTGLPGDDGKGPAKAILAGAAVFGIASLGAIALRRWRASRAA